MRLTDRKGLDDPEMERWQVVWFTFSALLFFVAFVRFYESGHQVIS